MTALAIRVEHEANALWPRSAAPIVAFQGERGAYGDLAIGAVWGAGAFPLACWDFDGVVAAVRRGTAHFGVLPLDNTAIGEIAGVRAAITRAALTPVAQVTVPVRHCLLMHPDVPVTDLRDVFSHPAALAQCRRLFERCGHLNAREAYDTAGAAREVAARRRPWEAAIASELCADRYGLSVAMRDIGDQSYNATRFAVLGPTRLPR